jgi:hypothetical protein
MVAKAASIRRITSNIIFVCLRIAVRSRLYIPEVRANPSADAMDDQHDPVFPHCEREDIPGLEELLPAEAAEFVPDNRDLPIAEGERDIPGSQVPSHEWEAEDNPDMEELPHAEAAEDNPDNRDGIHSYVEAWDIHLIRDSN